MRILHITSHLNIGGVTSYVLALTKAFIERRHHIVIASGGGETEERVSALGAVHWPVPLHTSVEFSLQVFAATRTLSRRLASEPADLLHAHTRVGQVVADRLSRQHRIPYVTTWHGFFRPNLGRWLWPCTGDAAIAISEPVRQHLLKDFHLPPERIRLIPHGIDPTPFESPPDPMAQAELRQQLRLSDGVRLIGTVVRLVPSKGVEQLIRVLPHVRLAVPDVGLLVIGEGPHRYRLEQLAQREGVAEVIYFAGALPETRTALSLMDVFVFLPAEQEGFGLSLLEAMASGRPIVAVRRGGGASWVLEDSGVGTLVEPDDVQALTRSIVRVLQNGEAACRQAGQARAVVKERYLLSRVVDQVEALYRELIR